MLLRSVLWAAALKAFSSRARMPLIPWRMSGRRRTAWGDYLWAGADPWGFRTWISEFLKSNEKKRRCMQLTPCQNQSGINRKWLEGPGTRKSHVKLKSFIITKVGMKKSSEERIPAEPGNVVGGSEIMLSLPIEAMKVCCQKFAGKPFL